LLNVHMPLNDFDVTDCGVLIATTYAYKNSSADEIANVNFYAVRPEGTRIRWNKAK